MKQLFTLAALLIAMAFTSNVAASEPNKLAFNPHWYLQIQGGAAHTIGEAEFCKLISPAAAISAAYQFTPVWALRIGVSGWQAKGAWFNPQQVYKFNYAQLNADVVVDLANWFGGFRHNRTVNPYVLVGVGGAFAFNNDQAKAINDSGKKMSYLWDGNKAFVAGRLGGGINFRVSDCVSLGIEMNTNILSDKFNSKKSNNIDWQINGLVGATFRLGKNYKNASSAISTGVMPAQTTPTEEQPAAVEPQKEVCDVAPVEPTAVEPVTEPVAEPIAEPIVEPDAEPIVEPVAEPVAEPTTKCEDAPAPPSPDSYKIREDIFFTINSSEIKEPQNNKVQTLINYLKANPSSKVTIEGYADADTGTTKGNYWLSGWRAVNISNQLQAAGVSSSRIQTIFKGDKERPYSDVKDNRVAICIIR